MFCFKKIGPVALIAAALTLSACSNPSNGQNNQDDGGKTVNKQSHQQTKQVSSQNKEPMLPDASLQKGDTGDNVEALQQALKKIGYPVKATSTYDADTTWAITDFQLQQKDLDITGIYSEETKTFLHKALTGDLKVDPGKFLPHLDKPQKDEHGIVISNPYEILSLVNKSHALPSDFVPKDLVTPDIPFPFTEDLPKKQMRKPAAKAMEKMFAAAKKDGMNLYAQSGYRSYERQESLFTAYAEKDGEDAANKYSARPGQSEHQTGLTMDVTSPDIQFDINENFADTKEGKWLAEHCDEYGFIIRYPKGKEDITKYEYEAWHVRYVGKKAAKQIMESNSTLEEYLQKLKY